MSRRSRTLTRQLGGSQASLRRRGVAAASRRRCGVAASLRRRGVVAASRRRCGVAASLRQVDGSQASRVSAASNRPLRTGLVAGRIFKLRRVAVAPDAPLWSAPVFRRCIVALFSRNFSEPTAFAIYHVKCLSFLTQESNPLTLSVCQHTDTQTHMQTDRHTERSWHVPCHAMPCQGGRGGESVTHHTTPCHNTTVAQTSTK
jgi:hypothetical protein